jgi:spermidine synthase
VIPFAVTVCGAVVMCLEMMAFRVLTPNFGGDVYVSGSIIGEFLAALSLGYYSGGRVADRWPRMGLLAALIFAAGAFAAVIPALKEPLLLWSQALVADLRWCACLYAFLLFGPSTILLGMVSPFAIRLSARHIGEMGNVSGGLYALSTFGSIFGTLFTSFYWIRWWKVSWITFACGVVLGALGIGLAAFAATRRAPQPAADPATPEPAAPSRRGRAALGAAIGMLALGAMRPAAAARVLYQKDTLYHRVIVSEDGTWRSLKFNRSGQAGMAVKDPFRSEFRYTDAFPLAFVYQPAAKRVLFIGCGAATGPKQFQKFYPDVTVEVVEIDPEVVEVAKRYFSFAPAAKTRVAVSDGRVFLNGSRDQYDAIIVDAYYADAIPFHLTTVEFMRTLQRRLAPGGVALFNVIGSLEERASKLVRSEYKTIRKVFPSCSVFPILQEDETPASYSRERVRNVILVATTSPRLEPAEVVRRAARLKNPRLPYVGLIASSYEPKELPTADVPLLTDDFAPVNNLIPIP